MKNIFLLPTDKPSILFDDGIELYIGELENRSGSPVTNHNIYITNNEIITDGDYYYNERLNDVFKAIRKSGYNTVDNEYKIILTTDNELINDGVQKVNDEFIKWFTLNPGCDKIDTNYGKFNLTDMELMLLNNNYVPQDTFNTYYTEIDYLDGFIKQFDVNNNDHELSDDDWKVSDFLKWLKINNFKINK